MKKKLGVHGSHRDKYLHGGPVDDKIEGSVIINAKFLLVSTSNDASFIF